MRESVAESPMKEDEYLLFAQSCIWGQTGAEDDRGGLRSSMNFGSVIKSEHSDVKRVTEYQMKQQRRSTSRDSRIEFIQKHKEWERQSSQN